MPENRRTKFVDAGLLLHPFMDELLGILIHIGMRFIQYSPVQRKSKILTTNSYNIFELNRVDLPVSFYLLTVAEPHSSH